MADKIRGGKRMDKKLEIINYIDGDDIYFNNGYKAVFSNEFYGETVYEIYDNENNFDKDRDRIRTISEVIEYISNIK